MNSLKTILLSLLLGGCATTIKGRIVLAEANTPLVGGKVNVQRLDSSDSGCVITIADVAADGTFETQGDLPAGEYLVEPLIPGFTSESRTVKTDDRQDLVFKAEPIPAPKRSAIGANSDAAPARGEGAAVLTPPQM